MPEPSPAAPRRNLPASMIVWLAVLIGVGVLLMFNPGDNAKTKTFSQSEFIAAVDSDLIAEAQFRPEAETRDYYYVSGTLKDSAMSVQTHALSQKADKQKKALKFKADVVMTDALWQKIEQRVPDYEVKTPSQWWRVLLTFFLPTIIIIIIIYFLFARQVRSANSNAMSFGKSRARMIKPDKNKTTFNDVAGCDEAKEEIREIVDYLKNPIKFQMVGAKIPKGALLVGPPGTGKTLLARAVAGEAGVPFFAISGSDFVEMFVGVGASRVRDMFEQARAHTPCLIFIDEIDAVGRSRFSGIGGGHDEREQTLNAILVEMDGLEKNEGVIILAATNRVDVLDQALLRPGRFDRQIPIALPDIKGRKQILDVHIKNIRIEPDSIDVERIARATTGFSGADLANLVNEAALLAARNNREVATQADFEESRDKVLWGRERRSLQLTENHQKLTAYHEAGHTIIALLSPHAIPVHKVTIIPRGSALGATFMLPKEDKYNYSRLEMLDQIQVAMGGRIAEEIVFGDITSGASADIDQVTHVARAMVCQYGMSEKLGFIKFEDRGDHIYLGRDITRNESCSEETEREIDLEIRAIVEKAYAEAKNKLVTNRERLDTLARELLAKETLDVTQIRELLNLPEGDAAI